MKVGYVVRGTLREVGTNYYIPGPMGLGEYSSRHHGGS